MSDSFPKYYRPKQAAEIIGVSEMTIRNLYDADQLRGYRINERGDRRISHSSIIEFMNKKRNPDGMA